MNGGMASMNNLLSFVEELGFTVELIGDKIHVGTPNHLMVSEVAAAIHRRKDAILLALMPETLRPGEDEHGPDADYYLSVP
jgi:hypothetical protein